MENYIKISQKEYQRMHLIYLFAESLDINKPQSHNEFWIKNIQQEINKLKQ